MWSWEPIHARGLFYAKSPEIRRQMTLVFQGVTEVDSLKAWEGLYLQMNVQCTCQCLELTKMTASGPKKDKKLIPFKSPTLLQKSWFGAQWQLQVCPSYMCCLKNQTERAKYNQDNILSLFLPDDVNKTSDTGKVTERRFMKTCWIWHCFWMEHQLTRPQKL